MNLFRTLMDFAAMTLRVRHPRPGPPSPGVPRILVIRRNRMGDMIYTLPLLHTLRRHHPRAHISVACDPLGAPIAQACEAVNDVVILATGWNPWQATYKNAGALQDYDWVIAAKGGFDRRLAVLARLTNATLRIGFERTAQPASLLHPPDPAAGRSRRGTSGRYAAALAEAARVDEIHRVQRESEPARAGGFA